MGVVCRPEMIKHHISVYSVALNNNGPQIGCVRTFSLKFLIIRKSVVCGPARVLADAQLERAAFIEYRGTSLIRNSNPP